MGAEWLVSATGTLVVSLVLRDIFHTLWHPQGFGFLARGVVASVWRTSKVLTRRGGSELAGPLGILAAVASWTLLSVIGFALVYLPWMPGDFHFAAALEPGTSSDVVSSLYLSLVTLATLGFGDITPAAPALRLVTPVEALIGFVLLTAAISWMLQVYPALGRRRAVAAELEILGSTEVLDLVENGEAGVAAPLLHSLSRSLVGTTVDLHQYAESYYFWERRSSLSLPANLRVVVDLIGASRRSVHPEVRQAGAALQRAADGLAERLRLFTGVGQEGASTLVIFESYACDHAQEPAGPS